MLLPAPLSLTAHTSHSEGQSVLQRSFTEPDFRCGANFSISQTHGLRDNAAVVDFPLYVDLASLAYVCTNPHLTY